MRMSAKKIVEKSSINSSVRQKRYASMPAQRTIRLLTQTRIRSVRIPALIMYIELTQALTRKYVLHHAIVNIIRQTKRSSAVRYFSGVTLTKNAIKMLTIQWYTRVLKHTVIQTLAQTITHTMTVKIKYVKHVLKLFQILRIYTGTIKSARRVATESHIRLLKIRRCALKHALKRDLISLKAKNAKLNAILNCTKLITERRFVLPCATLLNSPR